MSYKIAINAGHCPGWDSGACGLYSQEADITEAVAKVVCDDLELVGCETVFIQENYLTLIANISNDFAADVFVSIHCNSCENHSVAGVETFMAEGSEFGYILASCLQHQMVTTIQSNDRGVRLDTERFENGMTVLRKTYAPAALCELDFISNPEREDYLNTHIEEMAHAIARGVTDYLQKISE